MTGGRGWDGLLRFSATLPRLADRTFLYIMNKRFSLIIKLVDYLTRGDAPTGRAPPGRRWSARPW